MKKYTLLTTLLSGLFLTGCIEEETPYSVISGDQINNLSNTQQSLLYGVSAYMVAYNSWGLPGYYMNDWGYPCQVYFREVNGEDFPCYKSTYDYWSYHENGTYASSYTVYTWYYYYCLIRNANGLICSVDPATASTESKHYLGSALAFRAMAYLDLARSFEFRPTGYKALDAKAEEEGIYGLTVPIVTESTTEADGIDNPRVDFCTMYRFILDDLQQALTMLDGNNFKDVSLPGTDVVNGLLARTWMEIGSRMEEESYPGFSKFDVSTPADCYQKAYDYTQQVVDRYTPLTSEQWHDSDTGFNTANAAWMWRCRIGGQEQQPVYYCSFLGQIASEPTAGLAFAYDAYRCISNTLYKRISDNDWRKTSWIDPSDATKNTTAVMTKYQTLLDTAAFRNLPAYANLKFRPGKGNLDDANVWMTSDLPLMRVEEMHFIAAEALARTQGYQAGWDYLRQFIQQYRYNEGTTYSASGVTSLESFLTEMMYQKRIEFWGEGICFFDYKRLRLQVDRTSVTNYEESFRLVSCKGYVAPWMNYFIPNLELQRNTACKANPDVSGDYTK